jgi:hypothetical protein
VQGRRLMPPCRRLQWRRLPNVERSARRRRPSWTDAPFTVVWLTGTTAGSRGAVSTFRQRRLDASCTSGQGSPGFILVVVSDEPSRTYKPIHLRTLLILTALALAVVVGAGVWMLREAQVTDLPAGTPLTAQQETDLAVRKAQLRADVIRNILASGAAAGGLIALFVALRRQYVKERVDHAEQEFKERVDRADQAHNKRTADATELDATERRITELYVRAAEQLGSEKAPVRMAGLYALERLGQDNESHRQTIVNLICSYLRMTYWLPDDRGHDNTGKEVEIPDDIIQARREELQVRLTAQRILAEHLHCPKDLDDDPPANFWRGMGVNLSGATLVNFSLTETRIRSISLGSARLCGDDPSPTTGAARFFRIRIDGPALFGSADFQCRADFDHATFASSAYFRDCRFWVAADFSGSKFEASADFEAAVFTETPSFNGAMATRIPNDPHIFPLGWYVSDSMGEGDMGVLMRDDGGPIQTEKDLVIFES